MLEKYNPHSMEELLGIAKDLYSSGEHIQIELLTDMLSACDAYHLELSDADMIKLYPFINDVWLHLDTNQSTQHYIDMIIKWMKKTDYSVEEVVDMERWDVIEKALEYEYEQCRKERK